MTHVSVLAPTNVIPPILAFLIAFLRNCRLVLREASPAVRSA